MRLAPAQQEGRKRFDACVNRTREVQVRLLELDADLAAAIPPDELSLASSNLLARIEVIEPGPWDARLSNASDCVGLLVVGGLLTRDVTVAGLRSRELLGAGDLLRPWDVDDALYPLSPESSWTVLQTTTLAQLDTRVLHMGARWPKLVEEILHRTLYRSRWLAVRLAIGSITRVDQRLLLFFWHAAGRWGRVGPEGTTVPLYLTHEQLGELVGARRPSVTSALGELRERGELERREADWLLRGDPPTAVTSS